MGLLHHSLQHPSQEKHISNLQSQYRKATCPTVKAGRLVKDFNLREDVRHKHENDRHFYLCIDTTLTRERSFFRDNRLFFAVRTIVFSHNRQFFAVGAHRRSLADRPGGPLVHQHLLAGLCCIFTSTCLLDFAASSPAFACWTFLHLKVCN